MDRQLIDDIVDYENGDMTEERIINLFQKLINTGQAWTLQGHYGRMARGLIDGGHCDLPEKDAEEK